MIHNMAALRPKSNQPPRYKAYSSHQVTLSSHFRRPSEQEPAEDRFQELKVVSKPL